MKSIQIIIVISASLHVAQAQRCTSPKLRKEWSKATRAEQQSYIRAVQCLTTKRSKLGLNHTLFDDISWVHIQLFDQIHSVAAFLPWHRYFVQVYEKALQECGYTGNAMYWDWVADSSAPESAAVWDPVTGFGGNGNQTSTTWGTNCVLDGPFVDLRLRYWNADVRPHCLLRVFEPGAPEFGTIPLLGHLYTPAVMARVNAETTYEGFSRELENGPHGAVHQGVGSFTGDVGPQRSSPNDPIFFLHHTQVDRLWTLWQQQDPGNRTFQYGGLRQDGSAATLNDPLPMLGFAPQSTVRQYMDVNSPSLCYRY